MRDRGPVMPGDGAVIRRDVGTTRPRYPGHRATRTSDRLAAALVALFVAALVAGCAGAGSGPILANAPVSRPSPPATPAPTPLPGDPQPIAFPRDDGPHDRLMEWWYYTGHLRDRASGRRFGFEFVVFRAERGDLPVSWASHLALTDETGDRFLYGQRSEVGPQVDSSPRDAAGRPTGFSFAISGNAALAAPTSAAFAAPTSAALAAPTSAALAAPSGSPPSAVPSDAVQSPGPTPAAGSNAGTAGVAAPAEPWTMSGANGTDRLHAVLDPAEAAAAGASRPPGIDLVLRATKPPALHGGIGFVDFGLAGGSYYYSRTRMAAAGTVLLDGRTFDVDGIAWFDHQWGDFISVGGGGWDWFAMNLDDGTDITLSLVRAADGTYPLVYGTLVEPDGTTRRLASGDFAVGVSGHWTSPRTGTVYPAGWHVTIPSRGLEIDLAPTVADQELDTRATSGVVYWEGSQRVTARMRGRAIGGQAYVELTGYGG